ncbi:DNA-binding NarL/FixJ family response regulator [Schumannella luteola]|uniref:DNA-binding NarL/FixJ family response regulator n=1 Tax=Schumannella luteola TaxID=472059 RepID=A0A852YQV0_9MICO|nr:DNA-binding NarL/FixJ family response regulator [Schumannella luteola]
MSARIRVLVADDQRLFRDGIAMLLESQADLELVGSAATGVEAVDLAAATRPDVMLMDIRMPVLDGLSATERLLTAPVPLGGAAPRVLVVTTFRRDEAVARAIRAGASGFVTKDAQPEFLLAAIRTVHAGQAVIAPAATFDLLARFSQPVREARPDLIEVLSPREKEIFLLAAKGLSNAEIAADAFVEETTVKTHVGSILAKLGLRSRVQVVAFAWENGLVG